ncbi:TRAP transporter permease [Pontivivens nitratireducens]|uniref:TRAP transporter fused permease subunit n=1 Tax=Pontivivens nitratireducens TaxID=2758038 RepID=A0A6G7VR22_9RHOB|nr:TRAP transporter fused permease subunit [Pontibrevibacter nitratireducens]QIK42523.1 TRAP transporter fused permease subunit [Pontibrevibacter nitratireducens]
MQEKSEPICADTNKDLTGRIIPAPPWPIAKLIILLSIVLCGFQLYAAGIRPMGLFYQRPIHLMLIMMVAFLVFPAFGLHRKRGVMGWVIDAAFFTGAIVSGLYIVVNLDAIIARAGFWTRTDIIVGSFAIITLLEASRRVVGMGITVIGFIFVLYALAGPRGALPWLGEFMPGILSHRGASVERLVSQLYLGQEGIFGLPLGIAATYVFIFVLFGAVLEVTGGGRFFIDLSFAATGRQRGGPAKAAVVASLSMGSITGSAIANVATTGPFTIPLMKRLGYKPAQAGGIEAAASTGGQITPPLMGAGAFLIAEYTGTPYVEIIKVSIYPALLYLLTVYLFVHIIALKQNMHGIPAKDLPSVRAVMKEGWHFLLPLIMLIYLLVIGLSPMRVGFYAILSILAVAVLRYMWGWLRNEPTRVHHMHPDGTVKEEIIYERLPLALVLKAGLNKAVEACELGVRNALTVSLACAIGGIIVGVVGLTGLGLKFSALMMTFSGGNVVLALFIVMIASLILGVGLPVTASYIVLIILVGPAMSSEFGIPLLIVHLVVFWYSQDSNVTPPIALAGFAAAAIAKSPPIATSLQAWKFAKGLYIIPLFMVFNPEIIIGGPVPLVLWSGVLAFFTCVGFVAALEGYLFGRINGVSRLVVLAAGIGTLQQILWLEAISLAVMVLMIGLNWMAERNREALPA